MKSFKRVLLGFIKFAVVGLVFYFLAQKGFLSWEATARAFQQSEFIFPAYVCLFLTIFISCRRWQKLLELQDIHLSYGRTLKLVLIGNFFNIALPGAVSGDFVKAYYVSKQVGGGTGRTFGSLLFDRISGVSALVLVAGAALGIKRFFAWDTSLYGGVYWLIMTGVAGVLSFYGYLFTVREQHDPLLRVLRWLEGRWSNFGALVRIYLGVRVYHSARGLVLRSLGWSILIHGLVCFCMWLFAQALSETHVDFLSVCVVVPLGLLVTAVPIFPAGVGTGHAAFSWLFSLLGSQRGADIFSLFVLSQLVSGAIGGLVYLRFKASGLAGPLPLMEGDEAPSLSTPSTRTTPS